MFTFYAEMPTKNLIIEVPTFSEDQEDISTYTPAKFDASFDFQYVAYQTSSEFQLIGQAVCDASDQDFESELEAPYSYAPIYAEEPEPHKRVSGFEEDIPAGRSLQVDLSTNQQDTSAEPSLKGCHQTGEVNKRERAIHVDKMIFELSASEHSSQSKKRKGGRIQKLLSGDKKFLKKNRLHLGLQFNKASIDSASKKNRVPFKGSPEGRDLSTVGSLRQATEQLPQYKQDHLNLKPTKLNKFVSPDVPDLSIKLQRQQPNNSNFRECLKKGKAIKRREAFGRNEKEEGRPGPQNFVETSKITENKNVSRAGIYHYSQQQQQQPYCPRPLDKYACNIPPYHHHDAFFTERHFCIDNNLRFNLSKATIPACSLSNDKKPLDLPFFDHNLY